jgi:acyl-CoA dehydrogenase
MAKYACAETLYAIVDRCVQVLGSQGVTHETPVGPIFQELRAFRIYDGPSEVHLWSLARRLQRNVASRQAGAE